MSGAEPALIMGGLGAASNIAGGMMGGNKGASQTQTQSNVNSDAKWLLPYRQALVERQLNLSNQPYKAYPGLLQQFSQALQQENAPQQHPWDSFLTDSGSQAQWGQQQFVDRTDHPFNTLTAKPGESLPLALDSKEYTRYMQNMANDPKYKAKTLSPKQLQQWKKDNAGLGKYFGDDQPYLLHTGIYNQSVAAQLANQQQQQAPNIIDQYYAPRSMKGLLG